MRGLCELLWRYIHKKITPIGARFPARLHYLNSQINHIKGTFYLRRLEKFCVLGPICTDQFLASLISRQFIPCQISRSLSTTRFHRNALALLSKVLTLKFIFGKHCDHRIYTFCRVIGD